MLRSHLYVSQCLISSTNLDEALQNLVAAASRFNQANDISGALICTGGRFAQVIEGSHNALDGLIDRIAADTRHTDIVNLRNVPISRRRFGSWSLAYVGPSNYVQRNISLPMAQAKRGSKPAVEKLLTLIEEFARRP